MQKCFSPGRAAGTVGEGREMASQQQVIEGIDIEAALATLDDDTLTSDQAKDLFASLADKAKASSARVAKLPSAQLSFAELERSKQRLGAKLAHLHTTRAVLDSPADAKTG